jgi:CheY-like chemotaxis protein
MQRILSKTLQSYGFNKTLLASNGFEGVALAVEFNPLLIILDILMPELSGHLTLKLLKTIKNTKDIPVLMVSALSDVENLGLAVKSGTAGFISKPFTRATVYEKLLAIFGKEELEALSRGEAISGSTTYFEPPDSLSDSSIETSELDDKTSKDDSVSATQPYIPQDKLLQHYVDEEKRNIESIKKLLSKTKK